MRDYKTMTCDNDNDHFNGGESGHCHSHWS